MFTTKLRIALTAIATLAVAGTAHAKPRRVVVLDFDGPRTLADNGRQAIAALLSEQYDLVKKQTWEEAQERASKNNYGPKKYEVASKSSGVDAVVEGWVSEEGRKKVLNVIVREAATGREFDTLTFKLGKTGFTSETIGVVRTSLDDVMSFIEPGLEPPKSLPKKDIEELERGPGIGGAKSKAKPKAEEEIEIEVDKPEPKAEEKPKTEVATAEDLDTKENNVLAHYLGEKQADWPLPKKPNHVPKDTERFEISGGGYYASRSIEMESEDPQDLLGVSTKGLSLTAKAYPFPVKKKDGVLSGVGFVASVWKAPASTVTVQADDYVADYKIDSGGWEAGVHYRYPISSLVAVDGHVGYAQHYFLLEQDTELDVPDVNYKYFWGGVNFDLYVTDRATVGAGAKYLYVTDNGQMSELDWYGPGSASGYEIEANFLIPLPARLFVSGEIKYQKITTEFDAPDLSAEQARQADDSFVHGNVHVGIQF